MRGIAKLVAEIFIRNSLHITRHAFIDLAECALQDNTQEKADAIAVYIPPMLRDLLPSK
jgi:hypothetical protein